MSSVSKFYRLAISLSYIFKKASLTASCEDPIVSATQRHHVVCQIIHDFLLT